MKQLKISKWEVKSPWLRWLLFTAGALGMGAVISAAVLWIHFDTLAAVKNWILTAPSYMLLTTLIYSLLVYVLGSLMGRLWLSGVIVGTAALLLALVDYFKTMINGTPLTLADFGLATQLGEVAGVAGDLTPPMEFWLALILVLVCTAGLFVLRKLMALPKEARLGCGLVSASLVAILLVPSYASVAGNLFGMDMTTRLPAASNTATFGVTLALWRDAMVQPLEKPTEYGEEYMQYVLKRIDELLAEEPTAAQEDAEQPNVIFILSEAFFDLTKLPDLTYSEDPLANFHALQEEAVSGSFYSHYLGYGTGYIEMAMQYGVHNKDFGAGTNICFMEDKTYQYFDSLIEQYTRDGTYQAEMLHAYNDSLYNRTVTYPMLGYSDLYFSADMQQLGIQWEGSMYGGYYLKDEYMYKAMLQRMEEINADGQRAFLYGITMENHQPFNPDKFGYECQIGVESQTLSEENMEIVRVMLEGITRADQALGYLTHALRESEEPTIVVFFGDHRPNLFMTDGDTVYTKLGMCPDNETTAWTADQIGELYSTDYFIWANDAALLQGRAGEEQDSSITAIGSQLLELMDKPVSRYWGLLQKVSEVVLTNTDLYFVDGESNAFMSAEEAGLSEETRELLKLREDVIYDAFYGKQYITAAMNEQAGT